MNVLPSSHIIVFPTTGLIHSLNDFAVQPLAVVNDLKITISKIQPSSNFTSNAYQYFTVYNEGTTILNPGVVYYPDSMLVFNNANFPPGIITGDSIVWSLGSINPFERISIFVNMQKPLGLTPGTQILTSAKVEPLTGDATVSNNFDYDRTIVTAAFDPNMITVSHPQLTINEVVSSSFLEYDI